MNSYNPRSYLVRELEPIKPMPMRRRNYRQQADRDSWQWYIPAIAILVGWVLVVSGYIWSKLA